MHDDWKKALSDLRERCAKAVCPLCADGVMLSASGTHTLFAGIGAVPTIVFCEARAVRAVPLVEET